MPPASSLGCSTRPGGRTLAAIRSGWPWSTATSIRWTASYAEAAARGIEITVLADWMHVLEYLWSLGLDAARVAFTDVVPWYFVKPGKGSQSEAIASRFAPFAAHAGVEPGTLPPRPSAAELVGIAAKEQRRGSLRAELVAAGAPVVITLGQEALRALRAVADGASGVQERLAPDGYAVLGGIAGQLILSWAAETQPRPVER